MARRGLFGTLGVAGASIVVVFGGSGGCGGAAKSPSVAGAGGSGAPSSAAVSASSSAKPCPSGAVDVPGGSFAFAFAKDTKDTKDTKDKDAEASVTVAPHCLDRTEVTVAAYRKCVEAGACTEPEANSAEGPKRACNWKRGKVDEHPINCVDHAQAAAYCKFVGGRLPKDAEWEWSVRGGDKGSKYPWGDDPPDGRACWDDPALDDSPDGTCKVGQFPSGANPGGVLDLAGNVWEWTDGEEIPAGSATDRGGGWLNGDARRLLAASRNVVDEKGRWSSVGFRCAYDER